MTDPITPEPTPAPTPYTTGVAPAKSPVLSIISMIAGIVGLVGSFSGWTLLFSIAGVVLGHMGQKKEPLAKGFWITGLITGYIGIAINVVVLIITIIALIALASFGGGIMNYAP